MKKLILTSLSFLLLASSCIHKYGIKTDPDPKKHVRVFLHPRLIITGFKYDKKIKLVDQVNNERTVFDFYIPSGEQEIYVRALYTSGIYALRSESKSLSINAGMGDMVFVCTSIREIGDRAPTGGNVEVLIEPQLIYLKTGEEKQKALKNQELNTAFFNESCNALVYGNP